MADDSSADLAGNDLPFVASLADLEREHGEGRERYVAAPLGKALGLEHFGVNHETIFPGGQSSLPHAHSDDEEFVFVMEGRPTLWVDGTVRELATGDAIAFPAGSGIAHCFINDSDEPVKLLIVGEHSSKDRLRYPVNPEVRHPRPWTDAPVRSLGPHDGRPRKRPARDA
jgi:uncharacterized cupin superfamily protein